MKARQHAAVLAQPAGLTMAAPPRAAVALASLALAAFSLTSISHAAEVPAIGRLFNTPQQRAQLDAQRLGAAMPAAPTAPAPAESAPPSPPPAPAPLVLNGVVKPAGGKPTVWLNQEPLPDERRTVGPHGRITVVLPSGQRITLKPGQRYDETTGEVRDDTE